MKVRAGRVALGAVGVAVLAAILLAGASGCQAPGWLKPPFHEPSMAAP